MYLATFVALNLLPVLAHVWHKIVKLTAGQYHEIPVAINSKESFDTSSPVNLTCISCYIRAPPLLHLPPKDKLSSDLPSTQNGNTRFRQQEALGESHSCPEEILPAETVTKGSEELGLY